MKRKRLATMLWGLVAGFGFVSAQEYAPAPTDLKVAYDPSSGEATLTWAYQPHNWEDGAEDYDAFSIAGFGDWILSPAVEKHENPHVKVTDAYPQEAERFNSPQSWIVFCYDHVTNRPGQAAKLARYKPASGDKHFFAQAPGAGMVEDDHSDYLIRPVSQGGGTLAFDAFGIGGTSPSSGEKIMVMYSSRTSSVEDLQELKTEYFDNSGYRSVQVDIPENAKYVAIRYMVDLFDAGTPQEASYGVNVDKVRYYTEQPVAVEGFRIYVKEESQWRKIADVGADVDTFLIEEPASGTSTYGVSAVYAETGAESEIVPIDFRLDAFPAVDTVTVVVSGTDVKAEWTAPEMGTPQSYRAVLKETTGEEAARQENLTGTSCRFSGVESGTYTVEVVAVYPDGESDPKSSAGFTVSDVENVRLELTVVTDGTPVVSDSLRLVLQNAENVYDLPVVNVRAETPTQAEVLFESVKSGTYDLQVVLPYHAGFDTVLVLDKALQQGTVRLKENAEPVSSLIYARNGKQVSAQWTLQPAEWLENVENYASFEYKDLAPWILSPAVTKNRPTDKITWPNEDQAQSWAVFTPSEVANIADAGAGWTAHGDKKVFISLSSQSGSTKDYLIRAVEEGGGELRFFVNGTSQSACSYDVLYSETDSQTGSFVSVEGVRGTVSQEWKEVVAEIPADARYVAIAHVSGSQTRGALMVDDIRYERHTLDLSPKGIEVYVDGVRKETLAGDIFSYVFSGLEPGERVLGVKAVYHSRETDPWEFTVDIPLLEDPENVRVSADSEKRTALLTWTACESALTYNIYLDGILVCDTVRGTSYTFTDLSYGSHTAEVQAVFDQGDLSNRVSSEAFEIRDMRPVTLQVQLSSNGAPLAGAKVELWQDGRMKDQRTTYVETASTRIFFDSLERGTYTVKAYLAYHDTVEKDGLDLSVGIDNQIGIELVEHLGYARIVKADTLGAAASLEWELVPLQEGKSVNAKGFELYLDGKLQQTLPSSSRSHTFEDMLNGLHELGVKAVFYSQTGDMDVDTVRIVNGREPQPDPELAAPVELTVDVMGDTAVFGFRPASGSAPTGYRIYLDGKQVADAYTDTVYVFADLQPGTYKAGVAALYGEDSSEMAEKDFVIEETLAERLSEDLSLRAYPNPVIGSRVNVQVPMEGVLSLVDMQGRCLKRLQVKDASLFVLDVPGLEGGLYFLRFENGGRGTSIKLIVR